ncbi:MBL fold metallo-hydrolase [Patescibacteria group bacterium]|nr:MBL fold metallo-hydrolase [Patescibacteria group bacterium]
MAVWVDSRPEIYFLNIGQGDSTLIVSGNHQVLVDGGPDKSVMAELGKIMPMWDRTIDLVVLTHPQSDHLTGLFAVLERYQVEEILATFAEYDSSLNREWLNEVQKSGAKLNYADPADDYHFGDLYIDTLLPLDSSVQSADINEDSVILRVSGDNLSVLLMGDAGFATEDSLLNIYPGISADILRVGHHGSKYSSSIKFLERTEFDSAVISVGKNSYGHPSPETVDRLNKVNAKIYRTDQAGTIRFDL